MILLEMLVIFIAASSIFECASNSRKLQILWLFKKELKKPTKQPSAQKLRQVDYLIDSGKKNKIVAYATYSVIALSIISILLMYCSITTLIGGFCTPPVIETLVYFNILFYGVSVGTKHIIDCDVMNMTYNQNQVSQYITENTLTLLEVNSSKINSLETEAA